MRNVFEILAPTPALPTPLTAASTEEELAISLIVLKIPPFSLLQAYSMSWPFCACPILYRE